MTRDELITQSQRHTAGSGQIVTSSSGRAGYRRYDLLRSLHRFLVVTRSLVVVAPIVFSSPDETPVTVKSWSNAAPVDFAQTAMTELDGTSALATYGPPYNNTPGAGQKLGPMSLEKPPGSGSRSTPTETSS